MNVISVDKGYLLGINNIVGVIHFLECQNCEQGEMIWKEVTWINKSKGEPLTVFERTS